MKTYDSPWNKEDDLIGKAGQNDFLTHSYYATVRCTRDQISDRRSENREGEFEAGGNLFEIKTDCNGYMKYGNVIVEKDWLDDCLKRDVKWIQYYIYKEKREDVKESVKAGKHLKPERIIMADIQSICQAIKDHNYQLKPMPFANSPLCYKIPVADILHRKFFVQIQIDNYKNVLQSLPQEHRESFLSAVSKDEVTWYFTADKGPTSNMIDIETNGEKEEISEEDFYKAFFD